MPTPPPRSFLDRPADVVAPALLGCLIERRLDSGDVLVGRIVETEAYLAPEDRASHAFGGRRTARNESMYAEPGTAYVYFTYGMHWMLNVVCMPAGHPAAVLIRALEPLSGLDAMRVLRPVAGDTDLCSGPGKLCQAMAITRELDGLDLLTDTRLRLLQAPAGAQADQAQSMSAELAGITRTARVGVDSSGEWAEAPLRWFLTGSPHVSPGRPSRNRAATLPKPSSRSRPAKDTTKATPSQRRRANRSGPGSEQSQ